MRYCLIAVLSCLWTTVAVAAELPPARPALQTPIALGDRLHPIVDMHLIEKLEGGAELRLHPPCLREVVFTFDAPWEGPQSAYITMMADGDIYRMYYRGGGDLSREYSCMATSRDGIHWERPNLGLFEVNGSKDNNIIWMGQRKAYDESHNFSPFRDTNPDCPPDQRYKAVTQARRDIDGQTRRVLMAFVSADGVHWKRLRDDPIITEGGFDSHNVAFWDPNRREYVCYSREGREGKRSISRATSKDFIHWTRPVFLDFGDSPLEHFYTNGITLYFRAPHVYLGFPMRFIPPKERGTVGFEQRKTDGLSDAVFMSSHDGLYWNRPFMEALIRPGLDPRNWGGAHGNSTPAWGLLQTGPQEISIYWTELYDNNPRTTVTPQVRRGTFRLDGFVSVNAPHAGGAFVTRPLTFTGRTLQLNCSTSAVGSIRVELQDAAGRPIPGKTLDDCIEIWGDEISRPVAWKSGHDLSELANRPIRLRIVLKDADVYALRFASP